jgi:hypothetical protein
MSKIVLKVVSSYVTNGKEKNMTKTISMPYFEKRKILVDELIQNFQTIRSDFYPSISKVLEDLPITERIVFWQYIKKQMIDLYFPEVKLILYEFSSNEFLDKDTY